MSFSKLGEFAVIIGDKDNVATALKNVSPGKYKIKDNSKNNIIAVKEDIKRGFKISLNKIKKGEKIIKYNLPIGFAKKDIEEGMEVHIHNLSSLVK